MGYILSYTTDKNYNGVLSASKFVRGVFLLTALVLCGTFVYTIFTGSAGVFHGILSVLSLLAVFFRERWIFNPRNQSVTLEWGFLCFVQRSIFFADQIEQLSLIKIQHNKDKVFQMQFVLQAGGKQVVIDTAKKHDFRKLEDNAVRAAEKIGFDLERITI